MAALLDYLDRLECVRWDKSDGRSPLRQERYKTRRNNQGKGIDRLSRRVVIVIGVHELRSLVIARRAGNMMHLVKVRVNQPMVVIGSATCVDMLEGRKEKRQQHPQTRLYGRDTTHPVIDCSQCGAQSSATRRRSLSWCCPPLRFASGASRLPHEAHRRKSVVRGKRNDSRSGHYEVGWALPPPRGPLNRSSTRHLPRLHALPLLRSRRWPAKQESPPTKPPTRVGRPGQ
jgi:hypothetical protein